MKHKTINVLILEGKEPGEGWSAQCLEYDIAMQAKSMTDLMYEVYRVLLGNFIVSKELGVEPFASLKRAPPVYWQLFDQAKTTVCREPIPFGAEINSDSSEVVVRVAESQFQPA
ncbi:MAG: hypothetical protein E8D46_10190 [Nitrospira sp.]|nr:MAG: hypothetical protein E8D46_10190 [Nitrospira sp.]